MVVQFFAQTTPIAQTTPNSSNSFTKHFSCSEFRIVEAYAVATQPTLVFYSKTAPCRNVHASQTTRVSRLWLECLFSVNSDTSFRMLWNAGVYCGFQSNVLYLSETFSSCFNVHAILQGLRCI